MNASSAGPGWLVHLQDRDIKAQTLLSDDRHRVGDLQEKALAFNQPDTAAFKTALVASGFYKEWKEKFGAETWAELEKYTGSPG